MHNDIVPAFRFDRPRTPSFLAPRSGQMPKPREDRNAAKTETNVPASGGIYAQTGDCDAVAANAERFLHRAKGDASQPLGGSGWLQRAGLNIRKASDARPGCEPRDGPVFPDAREQGWRGPALKAATTVVTRSGQSTRSLCAP